MLPVLSVRETSVTQTQPQEDHHCRHTSDRGHNSHSTQDSNPPTRVQQLGQGYATSRSDAAPAHIAGAVKTSPVIPARLGRLQQQQV